MEAVDNPSYFSIPGGSTPGLPASTLRGPFSLLKRRNVNIRHKMGANTSSASCTSSSLGHSSAPTTPTATEHAAIPLLPSSPVPLASHSHHRRSFRSLLRSMSATHHHGSAVYQLQHQLLLLGEPRPSDMAPETCVSPHPASVSPSVKEGLHHQHRRNQSQKSLKSPKSSMELLNSDMVYCPASSTPSPALSTIPATTVSEELLSESPEEVFLGSEDVRYYNLTATMTIPLPGSNGNGGRRRHSIGTFLSKDRSTYSSLTKTPKTTAVATTEDVAPKVNDEAMQKMSTGAKSTRMQDSTPTGGCSPDWRHPAATPLRTAKEVPRSAHSRKRCNRCCKTKGSRAADMDDILIVSSQHSQAAALWVNYLQICFSQINKSRNKPPFKIMCVSLEDVVGPHVLPHAIEAKVTGVKLQIVILCPQFLHHIYENPGPSTTLGRLLQPDRVLAMLLGVEDSAVTEQHRAALISYPQWQHIPVKDQDQTSVSKFLQEALDIMTRVWRQQALRTERALFSVIPKKVKEDQNKVIVLLNEPIEKEDKLKVTVDKNGEILEVTSVKRKNPFTLYFQMPERCLEVSMLVSVHVEKNGQTLGYRQVKCESRMRELDQILRSSDNPLEFMCQTLGFSPGDREHLDNFLVLAFQRNLPPQFNLLHTSGLTHHHRTRTSPEEYPTLLHFAARYGLEKFTWQLLECPGGEHACEIRNACELTPAEMAEAAGHSKLASTLRGYMQMSEFTSMYSYLKIMSEGNEKFTGLNETEYHQPRPLSQTYQIPPAARGLMDNYQVPPTARPYFPPKNETGYMEMHPSVLLSKPVASSFSHSVEYLDTLPASSEMSAARITSPSPVRVSSKSDTPYQLSIEEEKLSASGSVKRVPELFSAQDELAEILNDFKNNVFSITDIEELVENWKKRNDVQQSFKDKQDQLHQMREEYETLQQRMKESMKRPTPFERIRNLFRGKPRETKESSQGSPGSCPGDGTKTSGNELLPVCQRPSSSLSLHSISSSSSGRMSTVSACSGASLGDSGTHSDLEERKMCASSFDARNVSGGTKFGLQCYEIPPPPKPLHQSSPQHTPSPGQLQTTPSAASPVYNLSIENRPPFPSPRPDLEYESPSSSFTGSADCSAFRKTTMLLQSPNKQWRSHRNNNNGVQRHASSDGDCEYLDLENSPTGNGTLQDYINMPGSPSVEASAAENVTRAQTEEDTSQTKCGTVGTVSPTPSDSSELPDYVNVEISSYQLTQPAPPIPPRNK